MKLTGTGGAFVAVFGLGLALAAASSCRPRTDDKAGLRSDASADVDQAKSKVSIAKGKGKGNTFEVRFYHDARVTDGQGLTLKWDVVSNYSDVEVDCAKLSRSSSVTHKVDLAKSAGEQQFGGFDVEVEGELFKKCTDAGENNGKLSQACQASGDWNGPKRLEGCIYADAQATQLVGRGWGYPKDGDDVMSGFGLGDAIPDIDEVVNYGKVCANRLGDLPPWDCRDGQIIPIKINGVEPAFGTYKAKAKCDAPAYLGLGTDGQCVPYARVGKLKTSNANVDTVYVCRRYKIGDSFDSAGNVTNPWPADKAWHNDVAVIQHDRSTGETCWYQALSGFQPGERPLPTWRVPPPHEESLPADVVQKNATLPAADRALSAKEFWIKPTASGTVENGFACIKCHDSDPFMLSPYLMQVTEKVQGVDQYFIPCDPSKPGQSPKRLCKTPEAKGNYSQVSKQHQPPRWKHSFALTPKDPTAKECVSCHRIGTHNTCKLWVKESVAATAHFSQFRSTKSLSYPDNRWMPVRPDAKMHAYGTLPAWEADFKKSVAAINDCCSLYAGLPGSQSAFDQKCDIEPLITLPPEGGNTGGSTVTLKSAADVVIPDNDANGVMIPLAGAVPADKPIRAISVKVSVRHPYIGHVKLELLHGGQTALIYDGAAADIPAEANLELTAKTGTSDSPLAAMLSQSAAGAWQIRATDATKHEKGKLSSATLEVTLAD